jgi:hypothetical protein
MVGWVTSVNQRAEASMQRINEFMDKKSEIINKNFEIILLKEILNSEMFLMFIRIQESKLWII